MKRAGFMQQTVRFRQQETLVTLKSLKILL